ncbi:MAG: tRNA pseudouridine(55) synthase TruB [Proteobacteria bacterium]|nr:tRNA pseudouridine(55) synthase TruB [Pseudomonadota bacterium]NDC25425.1 tRNA pseudouridine(55) synthase TruB [Pseudomonadota bacterium]NDD05261.1 tRNA pseudouridine(55) synthase TruB [Pseudomonadota bacterium]NDG27352.1 tRNA pseudouridine(55) synthase TruB [Pseudomonadota bacterium]
MMHSEALFIIDKPVGPTSFDVIRELKKIYPKEKIGHAGSLDPFATGVLVVLLGRATKLSNALLNADKVYRATLELGKETDSLDLTGQVIQEAPVPDLNREMIESCLASFLGEWQQLPPMFSAKKVKGVRLYELARQNVNIPRERVPVQLYRLDLVEFSGNRLVFDVHCSKGTYIRSLGQEIALRLGTLGYLTELRRLACGPFLIEASRTVAQLTTNPQGERLRGFQHFTELLRAEGLVRGHQALGPKHEGFSGQENPQLPRPFNSGNPGSHNLAM